jgi:hypothetical protein
MEAYPQAFIVQLLPVIKRAIDRNDIALFATHEPLDMSSWF